MLDWFWIRLLGYVYINHIKLELYTFSLFIYRSQISRAKFISFGSPTVSRLSS